jgi:hypothetical protein
VAARSGPWSTGAVVWTGASGGGAGHHFQTARQLNAVAGPQLAPPAGFLEAIDAHLTPLDALFCLATGAHQGLPLEELIQPERLLLPISGSSGNGGVCRSGGAAG